MNEMSPEIETPVDLLNKRYEPTRLADFPDAPPAEDEILF